MTQPVVDTLVNAEPTNALAEMPGRTISAYSSETAFVQAQRMAKSLASSSLVPKEYQNNIANVMIAMELANRIGASVFMVMNSLDIIHGRPSWRAQFLIATVNSSGKFTPLRFKFTGKPGTKSWGCIAYAKDKASGEVCEGAEITIDIAEKEGWASKTGSKWRTMPQQMLMYRAAAFWTRVYAPELSLGMHTAEEVIDTVGYTVSDSSGPKELPNTIAPGSVKDLESVLMSTPEPSPVASVAHNDDGEVLERQPGDDDI